MYAQLTRRFASPESEYRRHFGISIEFTAGMSSGKIAIDGSGFSQSNASFHYMKRIGTKIPTRKYNKLSIALDVEIGKIHALKARVKPRHDVMDVKKF